MKRTIYESDFVQEFADYNRSSNFSRDALSLIFQYLEEYDENYELDVIEICTDYSEVSLLQFVEDYDLEVEDYDLDDYKTDDDEQDEFNEDSYLKSISELITNECPEEYKDYKVLNDKLVTKYDNEVSYRILLCGIYEDENWKEETAIYFVTDLDYKYRGTTKTNSEAIEIGNSLDPSEFNIKVEEEKDEQKKKLSWEDVDEDKLKEIISEYINDRSSVIGFTNQGTVVFQDF